MGMATEGLGARVITAIVLLILLLAVLFSGSWIAFCVVLSLFFAAAIWETGRLFGNRRLLLTATLWVALFIWLLSRLADSDGAPFRLLMLLCIAIWSLRVVPSLGMGLPRLGGASNVVMNGLYGVALVGAFLSIAMLFRHSPLYLLSVMAIVWIADIGAYFSGKALGRHKLAPSISPGKSWEGAAGGWVLLIILGGIAALVPALSGTFPARMVSRWGWGGLIVILTMLAAASIVGDLFESQLKRRAGVKDSSNLLPGHGGVLDRIDALIPVLPIALMLDHLS